MRAHLWLAARLGCASLPELYERVGSAASLVLWEAWLDLDPQGEGRADLRAGVVAAAVTNAASRGRARAVPKDFMPQLERLEALEAGEASAAESRAKRKADEATLRRLIDAWNQ